MSAIPNNEKWKEFFEYYKNLPSLWDPNCKYYNMARTNRKKKCDFNILLKKYQEIDPNANADNLKAKLHNIRFCYRRERKKLENLRSNGNMNYKPTLWYFNEVQFLQSQDAAAEKYRVKYRNDAKTSKTSNQIVRTVEDQPELSTPDSWIDLGQIIKSELDSSNEAVNNNNGKTIDNQFVVEGNLLQQMNRDCIKQIMQSRDEADIYAENWAVQFRKLSPKYKILAKKAIEDILTLGQLQQLTIRTVKIPSNYM